MTNKTIKILLAIIAMNLTILTAKEVGFISTAKAQVAGMDFSRAVKDIIEDCRVTGHVDNDYLFISIIAC
jgi:hypothetical protein